MSTPASPTRTSAAAVVCGGRGGEFSGAAGGDLARGPFRALLGALTILILAIQAVWAVTTPAFRGPDEPHHVNSILRLASGNGWPDPGTAMIDPAVMHAARQANLLTPQAEGFGDFEDMYRITGTPPAHVDFDLAPVTPQPQRAAIGDVEAADPAATVRDQMTQHPPAYYALGAGVASVLGLADQPWDRAVLSLRLLSVALTAPLVPALVFTARRLGARRSWALLAGLLPLAIPQVPFIGAMVSNDAAAIGAGSVALAAMTWAATRRIDAASVAAVGIATGLALWTKGQLLALGLPLLLVFLLRRHEAWRRRVGGALAAGVLSQLVCPWWLLNIVRFGTIQPDGFRRPPVPGWDPATAEAGFFWRTALGDLLTSFVAKFGWLEIPFPPLVSYVVLAVLAALGVLGLARLGRRAWVPAALLAALAGVVVVLLRASWTTYVATGQVGGVQGRYLFPLLAIGAIGVFGVARFGRTGYVLAGSGAVLLQAAGLTTALTAFYPGHPGAPVDMWRAAAVLGFDVGNIVAVLVVGALALLAVLVGVVLLADRERPRPRHRRAPEADAALRGDSAVPPLRRAAPRGSFLARSEGSGLGARTARLTAWMPVAALVLVAVAPAMVGARVFAATDLLDTSAPWAETSKVTEVQNVCVSDTIDSALPHQIDMRDRLRSGELLPDFEGQASAGTPLGATPDTGTSSPVFFATVAVPEGAFTGWLKFFEFVVAVGGMILWGRRIGVSTPAGVLGGFLFVTSGFMLMWTNWPQTRTAVFFPLLFWAIERIVQERTWRSVLPFPLVLAGLVLGGFPVITLHAVYLAFAYALVRLVLVMRARRAERRTRAPVGGAGVRTGSSAVAPAGKGAFGRLRAWLTAPGLAVAGGGVALGLLAVQLAPWAAQLAANDFSYRENLWKRVYPGEYALTAMFAQGFGNCTSRVGFWSTVVPIEAVSFVGSAALVLVTAGLVMPRRVAPGARVVLAVGAATALLVTFVGGPLSEVLRLLPGVGSSGLHRTRAVGAVCFAMLGAIGADALLRAARDRAPTRWRLSLAFVVALAAPVAAVLGARQVRALAPTDEQWASVSTSVWLSVFAAVGVAGVWLATLVTQVVGQRAAPVRRVLAVVTALVVPLALLAEGVTAARAYWPLAPPETFYRETTTSQWLRDNLGDQRMVGVGTTYRGSGALVAGLRSLSGHSFAPDDWREVVHVADPEGWMSPTNMGLSDLDRLSSPVMDRLSVRYGVDDTRHVPPGDRMSPHPPDESDRTVILPEEGASLPLEGGTAVRAVLVDIGQGLSPTADRSSGLACVGDVVGTGPERDPRFTVRVTDAEGEVLAEGGRRLRPFEGGPVSVPVDPVPADRLDDQREVILTVEGCADVRVRAAAGQEAPWLELVLDPGDGLVPVPLAQTPDALVYENPGALPRFRWASGIDTCTTARECAQRLTHTDPATALVYRGDDEQIEAEGLPARIEVLTDAEDRQEVRVDAEGAGLLVVADAVHEGWVAEVDGVPVELVTVDGALRGVPVPAGEHEVTLRYAPLGRPLLLPLAVLTALGWAGLAVHLVRRDARRTAAGAHVAPASRRSAPAPDAD